MDIPAKDVEAGEFFASKDKSPGNVWVMLVCPTVTEKGMCQNIDDESFWEIEGHKFVRVLSKDEYDQKVFHV